MSKWIHRPTCKTSNARVPNGSLPQGTIDLCALCTILAITSTCVSRINCTTYCSFILRLHYTVKWTAATQISKFRCTSGYDVEAVKSRKVLNQKNRNKLSEMSTRPRMNFLFQLIETKKNRVTYIHTLIILSVPPFLLHQKHCKTIP